MSTEITMEQLRRLVEDYHQRHLSMADYRLQRRRLLADLDARINGVASAQRHHPDADQITIRKHQ